MDAGANTRASGGNPEFEDGTDAEHNVKDASFFFYDAGKAYAAEASVWDGGDADGTANDHIDAVYSMDDETSIGAIQAITEAGRDDIKVITGGGGCQEYFNMMPEYENLWVESALYSPDMVMDAVDMAVAILNGEEVEQVKIIPTTIVDKTNYQDFLDPNSPY